MLVVGVDGATNGWVAVRIAEDLAPTALFHRSFAELVEFHNDAATIAVDIPIGLPVSCGRKADIEARSFIGSRASSVFSTPPRGALTAPNHRQASDIAKRLTGKGISQQAYALRKKILEVDGIVRPGDRIHEIHPEVSFCALAQAHLANNKKTWNGLMARRSLLKTAGIALADDLGDVGTVAADDVLDAAVAAWSASRIANGVARTLPSEPEIDERGRAVAIWY